MRSLSSQINVKVAKKNFGAGGELCDEQKKKNLQHTKQFFFHYIFQDRNNLDRGVTLRKAAYRKGLFHLMNETINPGKHKQTADFVNSIL